MLSSSAYAPKAAEGAAQASPLSGDLQAALCTQPSCRHACGGQKHLQWTCCDLMP